MLSHNCTILFFQLFKVKFWCRSDLCSHSSFHITQLDFALRKQLIKCSMRQCSELCRVEQCSSSSIYFTIILSTNAFISTIVLKIFCMLYGMHVIWGCKDWGSQPLHMRKTFLCYSVCQVSFKTF